MSLKGTNTTADYINFDTAVNTAKKLMKEDKTRNIGLYILISIYSGLRMSDVLSLTWEQLQDESILLTEQKTSKSRKIQLHDEVKKAVATYSKNKGLIFKSQKGGVYTKQQINRKLKSIFSREAKQYNISSHSLRKSFGRRVYEKHNESEKALIYLSELFNHTSPAITRKYLGLRQEELDNVYMSL